ncbi:MAG: MarR family transcriptional regulator [Acidobacteriota bacterium]
MSTRPPSRAIERFLASSHLFAAVVEDVMLEALVRQVTGGKLTYPQFKLLKFVATSTLPSIGDVAAFLTISNAAASKAVDRMVRKSLLVRADLEQDRRTVQLSLTDDGARLVKEFDDLRAADMPGVFAELSESKLEEVSTLLETLSVALLDRAPEKSRETCLQCGIFFHERCLVRSKARRDCHYLKHRTRTRSVE